MNEPKIISTPHSLVLCGTMKEVSILLKTLIDTHGDDTKVIDIYSTNGKRNVY